LHWRAIGHEQASERRVMAKRVARSHRKVRFGAPALLAMLCVVAAPASGAVGDRVDDTGLQVVRWSWTGSGTTSTGSGADGGASGPDLEAVLAAPAMLSGRTLGEASFSVEVDARPAAFPVTPRPADQLDLAVVVGADPVGTEDPSGDATRAAIVELAAALPAASRFAVIGDDPPRLLTALTADRAAVSAGLRSRGVAPSSLEPALRLAADALAGARRPAVLMAGTGLPDAGYVPNPWPATVPLYAARVGSADATGVPLRNSSGGFTTTRRPATLVGAFDAIAADLSGQYQLRVPALPAGAHDLVVHVRAGDLDAAATIDVRPETGTVVTAPNAPDATLATGALPASPPAAAARRADGTGAGGSSDRGLVALAGVGLLALIAATVALARRSKRLDEPLVHAADETAVAPPAPGATAPDPTARITDPTARITDPTARITDPTARIIGPVLAPPPPGEVVVLTGPADDEGERLRVGTVVRSPADALREVVRRRATVLVIEPGADDPAPLLRAVANHDRASGGYTRVVQVTAGGAVIVLTAR
jgi:hypothetical protein